MTFRTHQRLRPAEAHVPPCGPRRKEEEAGRESGWRKSEKRRPEQLDRFDCAARRISPSICNTSSLSFCVCRRSTSVVVQHLFVGVNPEGGPSPLEQTELPCLPTTARDETGMVNIVIKFLGQRGLTFRGDNELQGSSHYGNFLVIWN